MVQYSLQVEGAAALAQNNTVTLLIDVLRLYGDSKSVAFTTCAALSNIVFHSRDAAAELVPAGGIEHLLAALQRHSHDTTLVKGVVKTLYNLGFYRVNARRSLQGLFPTPMGLRSSLRCCTSTLAICSWISCVVAYWKQ